MEGDRDILAMIPEIEKLVEDGMLVFLKFDCPMCGERVIADEPNKYCSKGYLHTEKKDGTPCGGFYTGRLFGYLLVERFSEGDTSVD